MVEIIYDYKGVACREGDIIRMHPKLKDYPELHTFILEHELKHSNNFNFNDVIIDFFMNFRYIFKIIGFRVKHPETFIDLLPVKIENKRLVVFPSLLIGYAIIILGIIVIKLIWGGYFG